MPRIRDAKQLQCTWQYERQAYRRGYVCVAGCDEVGRGALVGPLYAAAVILDPDRPVAGLDDSKKLSPQTRCELAEEVRAKSIAYRIVAVSAEEVDALNVYRASRVAMMRALETLVPAAQFVLTDAMRLVSCEAASGSLPPFLMLIHGDARSVSVAAASILAKVARDEAMRSLDLLYPQYGLAENKGYGTDQHLRNLRLYGPCPEHRRSFEPVRACFEPCFPNFA
jgi:ribonuclease HII